MGVVVDEGDSAELAAEFEAPRDPGEAGERPPGVLGVDPESEAAGDGRGGVAGVVEAGHGQLEHSEALGRVEQLEAQVVAPGLDAHDAHPAPLASMP